MDNEKKKSKKLIFNYLSLGLEFSFSVIIGLLLGDYIDKKLNTWPYMTFFLTICGFGAGIKAILRTAKEIEKNEEN